MGVPLMLEVEMEKRRREQGISVNRNLRRDLQTMRDELNIAGYEAYFGAYPRRMGSRVSGTSKVPGT